MWQKIEKFSLYSCNNTQSMTKTLKKDENKMLYLYKIK